MDRIFEAIGKEIWLNAKRISQALTHREPEDFGIKFHDNFIFFCRGIAVHDLFSKGHQSSWSADIFLITN